MNNFEFFKKGVGLVSPPHWVHDLKKKCFVILDSIN